MALRKIASIGHPILRERAREVRGAIGRDDHRHRWARGELGVGQAIGDLAAQQSELHLSPGVPTPDEGRADAA